MASDQQVCNIMIDFETLGVSRDAVILSVGIVLFGYDGLIHKKYYEEFSITTQVFDGRTVSPETVAWWKRTDSEELLRLLEQGGEELSILYHRIAEIREEFNIKHVWSRHQMDFDIINSLLFRPFPYYTFKDVATLDFLMKSPVANNHNALDDCMNQIRHVLEVYSTWNSVPIVEQVNTPEAMSVPYATKGSSS